MKARYTRYKFWPVAEEEPGSGNMMQVEPENAEYWGVYGVNPDGTHQHIGDAIDEDSAESFAALLNWLIAKDPKLEEVLYAAGSACNLLGVDDITVWRDQLGMLEDRLNDYDYDLRHTDRDPDEILTDALTNLRLRAKRDGVNFYENLERSLQHYIAETQ